MDRWRWLQHERAERPPNHRLPNAASSGRDESAQRASSFSGVHAFWSPGVRSGLASRTGMRSSLRLPSSLAIMASMSAFSDVQAQISAATIVDRALLLVPPQGPKSAEEQKGAVMLKQIRDRILLDV